MTSARQRRKLTTLQNRVAKLCKQLEALVQQRSQLCFKQMLLRGLVDILGVMQANPELCSHNSSGAATAEQLQELQQELTEPLPEEQHLAADLNPRIAPRHDPMALARRFLSQPPLAEAATITADELAMMNRDAALQASTLLVQMDSGVPADVPVGPDDIAQLMIRYLHMVASIMLLGRSHLAAELTCFNLARMQLDPEGMAAQRPRLAQLPPRLGLSEQQMDDIAGGFSLFATLLQPILQEQREQAELMRSSSNSITALDDAQSFGSVEHAMEAQQQHAARMHLLLHKEYTLRLVASSWFIGTLTWVQLARACVLHWPFPVPLPLLAHDIVRYQNQQQQQQEAAHRQSGKGLDDEEEQEQEEEQE